MPWCCTATSKAERVSRLGERRLCQQGLDTAGFEQPEDVVRWMGAMQAQDYAHALWAVAVRTPGGTVAAVEAAIAERRIVRTWPMRGTLHFVPAEDAKWMLALAAPRPLAAAKTRHSQLGLDQAVLSRAQALWAEALQGGRRLTREAMLARLEAAGIATDGQRGYHLLWAAAHVGLICMGPMEGKQQTFVLLDEWVPASRALDRDQALAVLAERYFTSHGPATVRDFAWWAGLTLGDARRGLEAVQSSLRGEGGELWASPTPRPAMPRSQALLLPGFDEFLLGYQDRSAVLEPAYADRIVPGGNGMFKPMVVVDGRIVGTWSRRVAKKGLTVEISAFEPLDGYAEALRREADRIAAASGLPLVLFDRQMQVL